MDELEDIISGIRESRTRTNIREVDVDWQAVSPQHHLGMVLERSDDLSAKEYVINFDPVESAYLHSLVTEGTLDKRIIMDTECFFKGVVFVDYAMEFILEDRGLLDDLYTLAKNLERRDRYLDPDLTQVAQLTGVHYLSHAGRKMLSESEGNRTLWRHEDHVQLPDYAAYRTISPLYKSLGGMVYHQLTDDTVKGKVTQTSGRDDVRSLIFVDSVLDVVGEEEQRDYIYTCLDEDYVSAAEASMSALAMHSFRHSVSPGAGYGGDSVGQ